MRSVLITGATGFLGNFLIEKCLAAGSKPVGIGHSEYRTFKTMRNFPGAPLYSLDISQSEEPLRRIIRDHNITHVVHTAALKHVSICEANPTRAIEVNVMGSKNVINACLSENVTNLVGISSDKALNPINVYGRTKKLMEEMLIENNFSVYRGVNFLFSTGSVLDFWSYQASNGNPITVNKNNTTRFFMDIDEVATQSLAALELKNKIINPKDCYEIKIHDLANAFCELNDLTPNFCTLNDHREKTIEEISSSTTATKLNATQTKDLLWRHMRRVNPIRCFTASPSPRTEDGV